MKDPEKNASRSRNISFQQSEFVSRNSLTNQIKKKIQRKKVYSLTPKKGGKLSYIEEDIEQLTPLQKMIMK